MDKLLENTANITRRIKKYLFSDIIVLSFVVGTDFRVTLYNAILRIARNFLETRENIKISTHPFYHTVKNNLHNFVGYVLSTINFVAGTNEYGPKKG